MKKTITFLLVCSLVTGAASAAILVSSSFQSAAATTSSINHTYVVSTTDLINGLSPSSSAGSFNTPESVGTPGGIPVLTDGAFPSTLSRTGTTSFNQIGAFATAGTNGTTVSRGLSLTYTLAAASTIGSIDVYGGWQDSGRDQQAYSVFYALASAPTTFILLQNVSFNPAGVPATTPVATKTTISENVTGILAADVIAIRFDFTTTENGYTGFTEIDVNAVPEPSAALLGGLGLLGFVIRRRS